MDILHNMDILYFNYGIGMQAECSYNSAPECTVNAHNLKRSHMLCETCVPISKRHSISQRYYMVLIDKDRCQG